MNDPNCSGASNNIYHGSPPIMADGRNFSNWNTGAVLNKLLQQKTNITSNFDYRSYLINNADAIVKENQEAACDQCCNCPPKYNTNSETAGSPFLYSSCSDSTKPPGYETSDLKSAYLSAQQLSERMKTPVITQYELLSKQYQNFN